MPKPENIEGKGFDVNPENINRKGYKKGVRNRSTIAKFILSMAYNPPEQIKQALDEEFPDMPKKITVEEIMTFAQVKKAIDEQDTAAYRALQDSAYGAPKQEHEVGGNIVIKIFENETNV